MRFSCKEGVLLVVLLCGAVIAAADDGLQPVLRVGTSGDYRPFSFRELDGTPSGFDIAVAQRLTSDLDRRLTFVPLRWPVLVQQLQTGAFDIAMSGVTVRADRAVHMMFSRPYAVTGAVAVVRVEKKPRFRRLRDLDHAGVRLGVNAGGHLEQVARADFPHAQLIPVADNTALPGMLRERAADAVISEELEARTWSSADLHVLGRFTRDRKAYALPLAAADLLAKLDDWLAAREADGWLNERRQWFGAGATVTPRQAAFEALVNAMDLRLQLMPVVAAVKRRDGIPIEDPAQETRVLDRVRAQAVSAGLNGDDVAQVFRIQIEAAKAVERAAVAHGQPDGSLTDLRAVLATLSEQIIRELARCRPWLRDRDGRVRFEATVRLGLATPGLTRARVRALVAAIHRVRLAPR